MENITGKVFEVSKVCMKRKFNVFLFSHFFFQVISRQKESDNIKYKFSKNKAGK